MGAKLESYIKENRAKGYDDTQIKTVLMTSGYKEAEIDAALNAGVQAESSTETPHESSGFSVGEEIVMPKDDVKKPIFNMRFIMMILGAIAVLAILGFVLFFLF